MDKIKESKRVFISDGEEALDTQRTEAGPVSEVLEGSGVDQDSELLSQVVEVEQEGPHQEVLPTAQGLINKERPRTPDTGVPKGLAQDPVGWLKDVLAGKPKDIADEAAAYTDMLSQAIEIKQREKQEREERAA